jgi:hypothetical protein
LVVGGFRTIVAISGARLSLSLNVNGVVAANIEGVGEILGQMTLIEFKVAELLFQREPHLIPGAAQFRHSFAQDSRDLRELLRPKDEKGQKQNESDIFESAAEHPHLVFFES